MSRIYRQNNKRECDVANTVPPKIVRVVSVLPAPSRGTAFFSSCPLHQGRLSAPSNIPENILEISTETGNMRMDACGKTADMRMDACEGKSERAETAGARR